MATIKIACKKCGQKVSGDERFFGTTVQCPICSSDIEFPEKADEDSSGGDDDVSKLPTVMDEMPAGLPTAPRPAGPPPEDEPEMPKPYQKSEPAGENQPGPAAPAEQPQQQTLQQQQQQPAPQQMPQYQGVPQQQQLPQGLPGQQLPGGPLMQPGMPAQPGMPVGGAFDQQGGMVTQGMPMSAPAPFGAMTVQPGQTVAPGMMPGVPLQHDPNVAGADRGSIDDNTSGAMPLVTMMFGIFSVITLSGLIIGPIAIIMGHLTLIKVNEKDKASKMKTTIGLILGYASLLLLIIALVIWKVASPDTFLWGIGGGGEAEES